MALKRVLIAVKTYPTLSEKYDELVCTAGFREDGTWIRIYPVPFRKLDYASRYRKWQWIELDLTRNTRDLRVESFRPVDWNMDIKILSTVGTERKWEERRNIVLRNVWRNMDSLIKEAQSRKISLAVFKPLKVIDFIWEPCEREWDSKKLDAIKANQSQLDLFEQNEAKNIFRVVRKIPYNFYYKFISEDGKERTMMIEDWELGMLYWNSLTRAHGDERVACQKVKEKYYDDMCFNRDIYFFLGTTLRYHNIALNPFIIIGTFYPPKIDSNNPQLSLDFPE